MNKKHKNIYGALLAAVVIIVAIWFVKSKPAENGPSGSQNNKTNTNNASPTPSPVSPSGSNSGQQGSTWKGTLKTSDSAAKGNLMLVTEDHTIYIKTSRDFSSLVNKKVIVEYEGTLESFTLKNITEDTAQ